jgi:hypothetical protein
VPGWAALALEDVPLAADADPRLSWFPLQHVLGFTAFGANAFVAHAPGEVLVDEHDELSSGQEELYLVVDGTVEFALDDSVLTAAAMFVVAVRDPSVRRRAIALEAGATLIVVGGRPADTFESMWLASHFEGVPRLL